MTRRDLIRWGIFTASGVLACKNGLCPLARSAFAAVPTGTPRSPLFGGQKYSQRLNRLNLQHPVPITPYTRGSETDAVFGGAYASEPHARRLSYHTDFSDPPPGMNKADFTNPITGARPDGGPPARRDLRPSALGRVLPEGRLRDVPGSVAPEPMFYPTSSRLYPELPPGPMATGHSITTRPRGPCRRR